MNNFKYFLLAPLLGALAVIVWFLLGAPSRNIPPGLDPIVEVKPAANPDVDPALKDKFDRIHVGMTLKEAQAIVGRPAGTDYSSLMDHSYLIWKSRNGWLRVWAVQGKVTAKQFDPELSVDE